MSLLLYPNQNQNLSGFKRINDSMSEKIKQNNKQKNLFQNNFVASNITSGINTEKRIDFKNSIEEINQMNINNNFNNNINVSSSFGRNGSQSSLSIDLNRFKINPNSFNNSKHKQQMKNKNINNKKINNDNFETFNPMKDSKVSINNSNENIEANNDNNENKTKEEKNNVNSLLKNFKPYDIKNFMGNAALPQKNQKNKSTFVYNISPSISNLQMILYNKRMEDLNKKNNPNFIFKEFYQKESRRMLVEYLKIYKDNNIPLKTFIKNENIHPLVIFKNKNEEVISQNKNEFNNDYENNSNFYSKNELFN